MKQTKCVNANEKNPNWLSREYIQFSNPIAMKYYAHMSLRMLEQEFLDNGMDGYMELCKDLCWEFMDKYHVSEKFNNYLDYWDHAKWLDNIVIIGTTNVVKRTLRFYTRKKMGKSTMNPRNIFLQSF
jgi:hypothetical protein